MHETWFNSWEGKLHQRRDSLHTPVYLCSPGGSHGKESTCNEGDLGSIPGLGKSPGGEHGNPPQYSCLENPQGQRSLAGYSPWGCKESDMIEQLNTALYNHKGVDLVLVVFPTFFNLSLNLE